MTPAMTRRHPDLVVLATSFWAPTCERIRRLARTVADISDAGVVPVVVWALLGSYVGPLDKYEWPELKWACERAEAARLGARLATRRPKHATRTHTRVVDLKPLVALESRPELVEQCPMVRRELYGLAGGVGVHWGPAVLDAWLQVILRELCG